MDNNTIQKEYADVQKLRIRNEEYVHEIENLKAELKELMQKKLSKEEAKLLRDIQKCKIELRKQDLKKSGYNSHNKYSYFELDDFLPCVEIILNKRGLASFFDFKDDKAILTILNEDGVSHSWTTKCVPAQVKENGYDVGVHMKSEQAVQTYARRTLWLQAMEITEPNAIESDGKQNNQRKQIKQRQTKKQITADKLIQPVREENNGEITAERIQDILQKSEKQFAQQQLKKLEKDRETWNWENGKQYIKQNCKNEAEFRVCKQSIAFKTADKV